MVSIYPIVGYVFDTKSEIKVQAKVTSNSDSYTITWSCDQLDLANLDAEKNAEILVIPANTFSSSQVVTFRVKVQNDFGSSEAYIMVTLTSKPPSNLIVNRYKSTALQLLAILTRSPLPALL